METVRTSACQPNDGSKMEGATTMWRKSLILLLSALILQSSTAQAGFLDWLSSCEIELSFGAYPKVTQPVNPLTLEARDYYGNVVKRYGPIHDFPVDLNPVPAIGVTGQAPLFKTGPLTWGLRIERQWPQGYTAGDALSGGIYASAPLGKLTAKAWYGQKGYHFSSGELYAADGVEYKGQKSAATMGLGATVDLWSTYKLNVALEHTGEAQIPYFQYHTDSGVLYPAWGYERPPVTIHSSTMLRVGVGIDFSFIPTSADVEAAREKRFYEDVGRLLSDSIPNKHRKFAQDLLAKIVKDERNGTVSNDRDKVAYWDSEESRLVVRVESGKKYERASLYKDWTKRYSVLKEIFPKLKADYIDNLVGLVSAVANENTAKKDAVPTRLTLQIGFQSFCLVEAIQTESFGSFSTQVTRLVEGDQVSHVVHVNLVIDNQAESPIRIESVNIEDI